MAVQLHRHFLFFEIRFKIAYEWCEIVDESGI